MTTTDGDGRSWPCMNCDLPQSRSPHPRAGQLDPKNGVGYVWECIPCLVRTRHNAIERARQWQRVAEAQHVLQAEALWSSDPVQIIVSCACGEWDMVETTAVRQGYDGAILAVNAATQLVLKEKNVLNMHRLHAQAVTMADYNSLQKEDYV